jgi:gluconate 2-dehydrogenase gamma chain
MSEYNGNDISRRDALTIMSVAPLAAAFGTTPEIVEGAIHAAQQAQRQQQHPRAGGQKPAPGVYKPQFFTPHEWRTVRVLVDLIIPRDERSGSATDAGVPEFLDFMMTDRPTLQLQMRGGLRWIDNHSNTRFSKRFVSLTEKEQTSILDEIAYPQKAASAVSQGVGFFNFFRDMTAAGFWSSRIGVQDIGYIGNQWTNWNGCPPAALQRLGVNEGMMTTRIPFQRGTE